MNSAQKPRIIAAAATALLVVLAIVVMLCAKLRFDPAGEPERPKSEISLDEQFTEVVEMPGNDLSDASVLADEQKQSLPDAPSGTDADDSGDPGPDPKINTSAAEQPAKAKTREESPEQIAREKKQKEEEEIKRKASQEIAGAFSNRRGKHTNRAGSADQGEHGRPDGSSPEGTLTGRGTGRAGGGWRLPSYAPVASTLTGSVELEVTISQDGSVSRVVVVGGQAPAATNKKVQQACIAEVRSRRFTRAATSAAPSTAKAYITYNFR